MRKLTFILLACLLVAAGGLLRAAEADWNKAGLLQETGRRLSMQESKTDQEVRRVLEPSSGEGQPVQAYTAAPARFRTTGYPLFLSMCYAAFGYVDHTPIVPIQIIQNLLDILTSILLLITVQLLLNRHWISLLVGFLYLVHPAIIRSSSSLTSEALYSFVNALILTCSVMFFKNNGRFSRLMSLACGAVFGIGTLLHPAVLAYLVLFIGVAGLQCFFTRSHVQPYLLILLGCLMVLVPWTFRQHLIPGLPPSQEVHTGGIDSLVTPTQSAPISAP
jgi:hypothetical protein